MTATHPNPWRIAGWSLLAALLALPAIAMRFTAEVNWTASDFAVAAVMVGALGLGFELVARASANWSYRLAMAAALIGAFLLVWVNLAVGIIGSEHHDANLLFAGVIAVGVGGACLTRGRAAGMAAAMVATAIAQTAVAAAALVSGWGAGAPAWPWDVVGATVIFDALWLGAALLFRRAAG